MQRVEYIKGGYLGTVISIKGDLVQIRWDEPINENERFISTENIKDIRFIG